MSMISATCNRVIAYHFPRNVCDFYKEPCTRKAPARTNSPKMKEDSLPLHAQNGKRGSSTWLFRIAIACLALPGLFLYFGPLADHSGVPGCYNSMKSAVKGSFSAFDDNSKNPDSLCPIVTKLDPTEYLYSNETLNTILHDEKFRNESMHRLLKAVQHPTQVYDDMVNPASAKTLKELYELDPRWKEFEKFHGYLETTFPLAHKHLELEKVNKFGLVFTWKGADEKKKPIMLTAHYDVVPVQDETIDQWTYPPFEGGFDGTYLYGRGVSDCKDLLVGLMETVELLLQEGTFKPKRTIILGFGYDEESSGTGAEAISNHLVDKYGPDSLYQIIDEGDSGFEEIEGNKYILPATGEKGHLNSIIELYTPGGHSSIPPKHTSIGLLSRLISKIEDVEFESIITNANPVLNQLQCVAEHSSSVDASLKKTILQAHMNKRANIKLLEYLSKDPESKFLVTTSQAVDIIYGGVKSNALPEHASVLINHRIAVEESVESTAQKVLNQVTEFAEKFDLGVVYDGQTIIEPTAGGYFNYSLNEPLEPAPVTPVGDEIWNTFGGALRYLYEELVFPETDETFIFAPYLSTGNTDTKSYWDLTRNIFRYAPGLPTPNSNIHSVDEKLKFEGHMHIIAFYYYYLQVVDQLEDPDDVNNLN